METDAELLARYHEVKAQYGKTKNEMERMKLGSPARTRKAQWAGSLHFTLLDIKSQIEERNFHFEHENCPECEANSVPAEAVLEQALRGCNECGHVWFEGEDGQPG